MSDTKFVPLRAYVRRYSPEDELEMSKRRKVIMQFGEEEGEEEYLVEDEGCRGIVVIDILGE